jgi:hypothetical protein
MRLQGIRPEDLIEVDDGLKPWVARVLDPPERQRVRVQPLTFHSAPRSVRASDVIAFYRKARTATTTTRR